MDHFESSWQAMKGEEEPVPKQVETNFKYQVANLPPNARAGDIETWSKQVGWQCRALRRFNNGSFLVGSPNQIPNLHMNFNGHAVLISDFLEAKKQDGPIVAGKLQMHATKPQSNEDPLQSDPWKGQNQKLGQPHQAKSSMNNPWGNYNPGVTSHDKGQANANTEKRFAAIEIEMQQLKEQIHNNHAGNQQKISQLDTEMGGIQQSLQRSLRDALQEQSSNLIAAFEALLRSPKHGNAETRERSRSGGRS